MIGNAQTLIDWLKEQDIKKLFEIKAFHPKRSLDANAYCWKLCTLLADALLIEKEDAYRIELEKYAPQILVPLEVGKKPEGYFRYFTYDCTTTLVDMATNQLTDVNYYRVIKGSSEFDSAEMARFIDCIIKDAQEMGIETLPPAEINRLKEMWK